MNIIVKRVESVVINRDTADFLRSLADVLEYTACELSDEFCELNNLHVAIEEFLDSENVRVE